MSKALRLAVPLIGGPHWLGGWNYMVNLARAVSAYAPEDFALVICGGDDVDHPDLTMLSALPKVTVVRDPALNMAGKSKRLVRAITTGLDAPALAVFRANDIDVVFEPAQFHGWRFPLPTIAWMPDFQHRKLPHMFSRQGWWRREIGFRAQIASNRLIMLSSADAEADCLTYYRAARGRTRVVRFATPAPEAISVQQARARVDALGLPRHFFFMPNQLWQHKNHAVAIEAARLLKQRGSQAMIVATGYGEDPRAPNLRAMLNARIDEAGLGTHFRFLGALPFADVQMLGLVAAAIVNPSRFEGWSTAVEEAKAIGVPMILSDLAVHREQAGDVARLFNPDNAAQLADYIEGTPPRDDATIETAREAALQRNRDRQRDFADGLVAVTREAAQRGR